MPQQVITFLKVSSTKSSLTILNKTDEEGYDDDDQKNGDQNEYDTNRPLDDLTLSILYIKEIYIKIKTNLNFNFHTSLWCLKRFYEGL